MTSYDQVFSSKENLQESLTPEEAVAAIAVVTAITDLGVEEVEASDIAGILWEFEVFAEYTEDEIVEIVDELIAISQEEGVGTLLNSATQALNDEIVWDGFAAGVILLLNEELVVPEDKKPYLKKLQEALELDEEEAQEIIQEITAAFQEDDDDYPDEDEEDVSIVAE